MILCEDWTRKFRSLMKIHELTNFTLENRALNPIVGSGWNFVWSLLIYFPILVKDLIPIEVR